MNPQGFKTVREILVVLTGKNHGWSHQNGLGTDLNTEKGEALCNLCFAIAYVSDQKRRYPVPSSPYRKKRSNHFLLVIRKLKRESFQIFCCSGSSSKCNRRAWILP